MSPLYIDCFAKLGFGEDLLLPHFGDLKDFVVNLHRRLLLQLLTVQLFVSRHGPSYQDSCWG